VTKNISVHRWLLVVSKPGAQRPSLNSNGLRRVVAMLCLHSIMLHWPRKSLLICFVTMGRFKQKEREIKWAAASCQMLGRFVKKVKNR